MPNITSVTVSFEDGIKREEYGPTKKASVSITAAVAEDEDGETVLKSLSDLVIAKVADMLDAPKPAVADDIEKRQPPVGESVAVGGPPPRRSRGPNKPKDVAPSVEEPQLTSSSSPEPSDMPEAPQPAGQDEDEWASAPEDIEITDQELLSATSKRAGELGAREPIVKLISTFATRTEGAPFKVQEIPQPQRKDYLAKLAGLTA